MLGPPPHALAILVWRLRKAKALAVDSISEKSGTSLTLLALQPIMNMIEMIRIMIAIVVQAFRDPSGDSGFKLCGSCLGVWCLSCA